MYRTTAKIGYYVIFLYCMSLIELNQAYSGIIPVDPDNPGKCVYRGDLLQLGENLLTPCQRLTCNEDGSIFVQGCGKLRLENCNQGERINSDKFYPECCKVRYKCKKADGSHFYVEKDLSI